MSIIYSSIFLDKSLKKCRVYKNSDDIWMISMYDIFDIYVEMTCKIKKSDGRFNQVIKTVRRDYFLESLFQRFRLCIVYIIKHFDDKNISIDKMSLDRGKNDPYFIMEILNKIPNLYSGFIDSYETEYIVYILTNYVNIYMCQKSDILENFDRPEFLIVNIDFSSVHIWSCSNCIFGSSKDIDVSINQLNKKGYGIARYEKNDLMKQLNIMKLRSLNDLCIDKSKDYNMSIRLYKLINIKLDETNKKLHNLEIKYNEMCKSNYNTEIDILKKINDTSNGNRLGFEFIYNFKSADIRDKIDKNHNDTKNIIIYMCIYITALTVLIFMK